MNIRSEPGLLQPALQAARVLLVDDDADDRAHLTQLLAEVGVLDVQGCAHGGEALAHIARAGAPDVVLCDLDMPRMDGMEFIRHVSRHAGGSSIVIVSRLHPTLLELVRKMARAYQADLLGILSKPVQRDDLHAMLMRRVWARPAAGAARSQRFSVAEIEAGLKRQEFEPYFQPKIDLPSGAIVGAEALARWRHPELGLVGPDAFIEVLEDAGRIEGLTFEILQRAAQACHGWHRRGRRYSIAVNLSLGILADPDLAGRIIATLAAAGLPPRHLVLEITESTLMTDSAAALENLSRLRMHGCGLSVDDFGTGFSNLQRLTRIPFTELKIDQSFVSELPDSEVSRVVVESSLQMARRLGLRSVAEGVETAPCLEALRAAGCNEAQGFLIAQPLAANAFDALCDLRT